MTVIFALNKYDRCGAFLLRRPEHQIRSLLRVRLFRSSFLLIPFLDPTLRSHISPVLFLLPKMEESHVVEMRRTGINGDDQTLFSAMQHHPLTEISTSPGHLLLLKLWQRNEELITSRVVTEESRLDAAKMEAFQFCSAFFFFHGLFFTLLFTSSVGQQSSELPACRGWWVPSFLSLFTCLVLIISVQASICSYWKIHGKLQRERGDGRALARCVQELRMKGASFDLSKEPQGSLRMKSSSVEIKWRLINKWCSRNAVTIFLLCFSGMVFPACKFILCS